jgi:hypothetical protein
MHMCIIYRSEMLNVNHRALILGREIDLDHVDSRLCNKHLYHELKSQRKVESTGQNTEVKI